MAGIKYLNRVDLQFQFYLQLKSTIERYSTNKNTVKWYKIK